jgi:hypothetical protein
MIKIQVLEVDSSLKVTILKDLRKQLTQIKANLVASLQKAREQVIDIGSLLKVLMK